MIRSYDSEVSVVEGGNLGEVESLGRGYHRGIDRSEWQIPIAPDEFSNTKPVLAGDGFTEQVAGGEVPEEADFGLNTEPAGQQVRHLGYHQYGHEQGTWVRFDELESFEVVVVVDVDVGV